jgi:hypothetical protein
MKIFLSWSGNASRKVAECLSHWLPTVIQAVEPFISVHSIEKGERWHHSVSTNLDGVDFGIVILTKANLKSPWINFEAGALSKNIKDEARLVPLLVDITDSDLINHPLSHFQYVRMDRAEFLKLFRQINKMTSRPLSETRLDETFGVWFEQFFDPLREIKSDDELGEAGESKPRRDNRMESGPPVQAAIDEMLNLQRRILRSIESENGRQTTGRAMEPVEEFSPKKSLQARFEEYERQDKDILPEPKLVRA